MQTKITAKRLLAVVMAVLMMLAAIPFSAFAADETTEYIVFGKDANAKAYTWQVLELLENGNLLLVLKEKTGAKTAFTGTDFATSNLFKVINDTFYNTFSDAEKELIADTTITYKSKDNDAATVTAKVVIPTKALHEKYKFSAWSATNSYWFADYTLNSSGNDSIVLMKAALNSALPTARWYYRPIITLKAEAFAALPKVDGVTYKTADGSQDISYAPIGSTFTVTVGEDYADYSNVVVKAAGSEITADDGVYTATASPITVEGIQGKPAVYDAYNEAVASTKELVEDNYTAESWAALQEALAADVAGLTFVDQAKVDAATKAISDAVAALKAAPADFTEYDAAIAQAQYIVDNPAIFNHTAADPDTLINYITAVEDAIDNVENIKKFTKLEQDLVDAATAEVIAACEKIPYKDANTTAWKACIDDAAKITVDKYEADYVAAVQAIVAEVLAEHDYVNDPVTAYYQADIDAATKRMRDVIGDKVYMDSKLLKADFAVLEEALNRAAAYVEENYYKDDDVERQEEKGGTDAWNQFAAMKLEAERVAASKANNPTKLSYQKDIDEAAANLVAAMDRLDQFIKLDKWDRFVKDVNYFFSDIKYEIEGIIALMKTVFSLLGMLFRGEIDLYGLVEMLGVDQEVLDFLISIGITPKDYIEPEVPAEPAA